MIAASPEPDASSSLTDFGNFIGVDLATTVPTSTVPPTSSAADLAGVDSNVATSSANKPATKDEIMALYGPVNHSAPYNMPGNCC